jgi:hypothetical protein
LRTKREFGEIVVNWHDGQVTRVPISRRLSLLRDYTVNSGLGGKPATAIAFSSSGFECPRHVRRHRRKWLSSSNVPAGLDYNRLRPTCCARIHPRNYEDLFEAIALVVLVVLVSSNLACGHHSAHCHSGFVNQYVRRDACLRILDQQRLAFGIVLASASWSMTRSWS